MNLSFSIESSSLTHFLDHWSTKYSYPNFDDAEKYDPYVGKALTNESRLHLFEWKNGSKIARKKLISIETNYPLSFGKADLEKRYLDPKAQGGAIWNIFYMHCIDPSTWPIFDQHTFRAMRFIQSGQIREIYSAKSKIYDAYKSEYIPFAKGLNANQRKTDKALFAFGQFLKLAQPYA